MLIQIYIYLYRDIRVSMLVIKPSRYQCLTIHMFRNKKNLTIPGGGGREHSHHLAARSGTTLNPPHSALITCPYPLIVVPRSVIW